MAVVPIFVVSALCLQFLTGGAEASLVLRILPRLEYLAVLGTEANFTCVVAGDASNETIWVKWYFKDAVLNWCNPNNLTRLPRPASVSLPADKGCVLTIHPVRSSSGGMYRCSMFDGRLILSKNMRLNVIAPNSTIDLLDLSTGNLVDSTSGSVCMHTDMGRTFKCTVRKAQTGVRTVSWIVGEAEEEASVTELALSPSELVDMSSWYTVSNWRGEAAAVNLTCRSTGHKLETLSVTVQLRSCSDEDISECADDSLSNCDPNAVCVDSDNGFSCTCKDGFTGDGSIGGCQDIDECSNSFKSYCDVNAKCINTVGKYTCSCKDGFFGDGATGECQDTDECGDGLKNSCGANALCVNTVGSFSCKCNNGFTRDGSADGCEDINECDDDSKDICGASAECVNSIGGFSCECYDGFRRDEMTGNCKYVGVHGSGDNTVMIAVISALGTLLAVGAVVFAARSKKNCRAAPSPQSNQPAVEAQVEMNEAAAHLEPGTASQIVAPHEHRIKEPNVKSLEYRDESLPAWAANWEILWSDLVVHDRILGSGNFGEVRFGAVRVKGIMITSAIKTLKGHASRADRDDFMDEFQTMTTIGYHPNIVSLLGACHYQDVLYVALEYLPHGDLRSYLRTARSQSDSDEDALSSSQLVKFALDVAHGMKHIAASGVIHRDLAARNILLGDGFVAKVSDFGLSRGENIYVQTSSRRVPIRWLAIESVRDQTYTTQSDVWSFGILLWEIATLGGTPYPSIQSEFIGVTLQRGYRMPKPISCDDQVYAMMRRCWKEDPDSRPSFADLVSILTKMANSEIRHTYMRTIRDRSYGENLSVIRPEFDDN